MTKAADLKDRFVPNFFFGCEADDPLVAWAFREDVNPFGARLRPIFGSDISHWDVQDMTEPVEEAYELVEHGLIGADPLRLGAQSGPDAAGQRDQRRHRTL